MSIFSSHSALNNYKQRNGFTEVKGNVSLYLNAVRIKKKIFNSLTPEILEVLYELGYNSEKINMAFHKPLNTGKDYNDRLRVLFEKNEIYAMVYILSGRNHMNKLTPKIEELWMKDLSKK